jgi:serine/threonine-protein kinase
VSWRSSCYAGWGAAHDAGVLHLDFKSQNVMLRDSGRAREAMIMDFSLSRAFETEARMHASERQLVGTPGYISPEQLECRTTLGPPSDIYSFGVVFYEMLTGRLPFGGQNATAVLLQQLTGRVQRPSHVVPGLTPIFDRFVLKCLHRDPNLRFPDTASALQALEACLAQLRTPDSPALRRRVARRLLLASAAALTAGLVAFADTKRRADAARDIQSTATELQPQRPETSVLPPVAPLAPGEPGPEPEAPPKPALPAPVTPRAAPVAPDPQTRRTRPSRPAPAAAQRPATRSTARPAESAPTEPAAPKPFSPSNAPARLY